MNANFNGNRHHWLTAFLLLSASAVAADGSLVVSRDLCNGLWMVPLKWTSKSGERHELTAVFDTGGLGLFVDPDSLERISGKRIAAGKEVSIEGVSASGLKFSTFRPRVRELDHLAAALGRDFDVFLPYRAFRHKLLVLDYPARELRLEDGILPKPDGKTVFSAHGRDRRPWLQVDLAGTRRRLLIDSGSNGRIAVNDLRGMSWVTEPVPLKVSATFGGDEHRPIGRVVDELIIANLKFSQPILSITDDTELIGVHVLKHFVITFDQQNRRVRFDPVTPSPVRMEPERGTGAVFRADPTGFLETVRVLPGTPAEQAGLRAGDRIVTRNGVPVAERGCKRLDEPNRERVLLEVQRDGEIRRIEMPVVELIE